jgi:DNA-directed RNA polymerase alpha subunit
MEDKEFVENIENILHEVALVRVTTAEAFENLIGYIYKIKMGPANAKMCRRITDIYELSVRTSNCLKAADIVYLGELVCWSSNELSKIRGFGHKSLWEIKEVLHEDGLYLGMRLGKEVTEALDAVRKTKKHLK